MTSRTPSEINFLHLLNASLSENEVWRLLFEKVGSVIDELTKERIEQLVRLRDPQHVHRGDFIKTDKGIGRVTYVNRKYDPTNIMLDEILCDVPGVGSVAIPFRSVHERSILINGAKSLGFDYFSNNISDEDYARIYKFVSSYWQSSGTPSFIDMMGFIKNMRLEINQLWTRDKGDSANSDDPNIQLYTFLEPFDPVNMIPVWDSAQILGNTQTGLDYPTAHVEILYDLKYSETIDPADIINLFYYLAPIHLVLERIVAAVYAPTITSYRGHAVQIHYYDHSMYEWCMNIDFQQFNGLAYDMSCWQSSSLTLDSSFLGLIDYTNSDSANESLAALQTQLFSVSY